jgi:hypothetical protein
LTPPGPPNVWHNAEDGRTAELIPRNLHRAVKVMGEDVGSVWWADYDQAQEIAARDEHESDPLPRSWTG